MWAYKVVPISTFWLLPRIYNTNHYSQACCSSWACASSSCACPPPTSYPACRRRSSSSSSSSERSCASPSQPSSTPWVATRSACSKYSESELVVGEMFKFFKTYSKEDAVKVQKYNCIVCWKSLKSKLPNNFDLFRCKKKLLL